MSEAGNIVSESSENDTVSTSEHESDESSQASGSSQISDTTSQASRVFSSENVHKYELIPGKRRDCFVLHSIEEKQLYIKNKKLSDGSVAYTCREKRCNARLYLYDGVCYSISKINIHNHANKESVIAEMLVETKIKNKCAEIQPSQTTSQISDVREIFNNSMIE